MTKEKDGGTDVEKAREALRDVETVRFPAMTARRFDDLGDLPRPALRYTWLLAPLSTVSRPDGTTDEALGRCAVRVGDLRSTAPRVMRVKVGAAQVRLEGLVGAT